MNADPVTSAPARLRERVHVADQAKHRIRPRAMGRRLVLQQGDPCASGGGIPSGVLTAQPGHARRRRRHTPRHPREGRRPGHPRRPLIRRKRHHRRGNRRPRRRARLHRRPRPRRDRDIPKPAGPIPRHRRLLPHRSRRRAHLAAPVRHRPLLRRPVRAGTKAGLGNPSHAGPGPVRRATRQAPRGGRSRAGTSWPTTTTPSTPTWSDSPPSAWTRPPTSIDSSHVPMLSHPDFVLDVIRAAATGV